jgi:hypothetical protein
LFNILVPMYKVETNIARFGTQRGGVAA